MCIQSNIKSQFGCGYPIIVNFFAEIDENAIHKEINYDFKAFESDEFLIRTNSERYCLKQAYKICYYVSKMY